MMQPIISNPGIKRNSICYLVIFTILLNLQASVPSVIASTPNGSNQTADEALSLESIDEAIDSIGSTLDKITTTPTDILASELGLTADQIRLKIESLNDLSFAYVRMKNALFGLEKTKNEQQTIQQSNADFRTKGMSQKPPYSLTYHDSIQAEISAVTKSKQNVEVTVENLTTGIRDFKDQLSKKEKDLRQFKEKLKGTGEQNSSQNIVDLEIRELSVQSLRLSLRAMSIEMSRYEIERQNAAVKIVMLKEQGVFVESNVTHDKDDLDHQLELILNKEISIREEIKTFRDEQKSVELELISAQRKLSTAKSELERNIAQAFFKAREEWRKAYLVILELKQDALILLNRQKTIWQQRYAVVKDEFPKGGEKQIKEETKKDINSLNQALKMQQSFLVNLQKQISSMENLIQEVGVSQVIKKHLSMEIDALRKQFDRRLEFQSVIVVTDQIARNLLFQVEKIIDQPSFKDRFSGLGHALNRLWFLEIWVVDQQSVSIGKVVVALIILVIGIILSRFCLHIVHKRLLASSQFKDTTASAVYKFLSYFAYLLVFLFALRIVNIPLTAFAFLGGAIAIGVGFGAQNLLNNLISGFIILGEQPITTGDLIEVDGVLGKVEKIGVRCTRVRTGENVHKLVPNSSILEKTITNWTHSDNQIRTKVIVGIAYGSPVKKAEEILIEAAQSNPNVLKRPEPFVLFADFGDSSLVFEVYFWVLIRVVLEKRQIESQIRFEIDSRFRQEGLIIAFPQQGIHFDSNHPLKIEMIRKKDEACHDPG